MSKHKKTEKKLYRFFAKCCLKFRQELKESLDRRKKDRLLDHLLWVGIIFIVACIINTTFGLGWATITIVVILLSRVFYNMEPQGFLTICAILIAAHQLYLQNTALDAQLRQNKSLELSIKQQTKQFILDKRPYLFVRFSKDLFLRKRPQLQDILCGVEMIFQNSGRLPATIIDTQCKISDDTGRHEDFENWHKGTYGGFPELKVIPPQDIRKPPKDYIPAISENANLACIAVVISYRGPESDSVYWAEISQFWKIERDAQGNLKKPFFLDRIVDWDESQHRAVPQLQPPSWSKYKQ